MKHRSSEGAENGYTRFSNPDVACAEMDGTGEIQLKGAIDKLSEIAERAVLVP